MPTSDVLVPEEANPYDTLLQGEADRLRAQQNATISTALDTNPDQYATQRRVAGYLGYPVAAVAATPEQSQREAQTKQIDADSAPHPVLQRKYTDEDFAKLAHDDSLTLGQLAGAVSATAKYVFSAEEKKGLASSTLAAYHALARGFAGGFRAVSESAADIFELNPFVREMEQRGVGGGNPLRRLSEGFGMLAQEQGAYQKQASTPEAGTFAAGVDSGIQSLAGNAALLPLALLPGGQGAALAGMVSQSGGAAYQQAREQGLPNVQALPFAASQAAIEYATEKIPLTRLVGDIQAGSAVYKTLARQIASEVPGEQVATILQDMNEWAVLPENKDKPFAAYLAERPGAAAQTLIATVVGVGGNVALLKGIQSAVDNAQGQTRQHEEATQTAEQLGEIFKLASQSKLRERAPQLLADFVQEQAEDAGAPTEVYVDARALAGEGGLLNQEQIAQLPSLAPQLAEALATGGDVAIPIGELTAAVAGTPLEQKLIEHLKTDPEALSQFESKQAQEQAAAFLKDESQRIASESADANDAQRSAEAVHSQILQQLSTANRFTPEVNTAYASLVREFYTTMGARLGQNAEEAYRAHPLRVEASGIGALEQVAYHGTPYTVDKFTTQKIGTGEGAQAYGWGMYFAKSKDIAEFYRKSVSDDSFLTGDGSLFNPSVLEHLNVKVPAQKGDLAGAIAKAEQIAASDSPVAEMAKRDLAKLRAVEATGGIKKNEGQTYTVEIPEDEDMLDYDAPFKEQSPKVQAALEKLGISPTHVVVRLPNGKTRTFNTMDQARRAIKAENLDGKPSTEPNPMTGKEIYEELIRRSPATEEEDVPGSPKGWGIVAQVQNDTDGSPEAASRALLAAGIPGLRYLDAGSRGTQAQRQTHNFVVFDDSHVEITGVLNQGEKAPRGTFNPKTLTISLLEQADLSTFLHETGHFFLEVMADVAAQPNAPPAVAEDMSTLLKWFGVNDVATWNAMSLEEQRPHHEKFAESFEQYLFEGKAPSQELQPLFSRFRAWMTNVYKSLSDFMASHNTKLSKEVRGVFDRMLASDQAIQEAEAARAYAPLFKAAEAAGMTPQEWAAYQALGEKATATAVEQLEKRSLRDMRWATNARSKALRAIQRDVEAKRKATEAEVREELSLQPVEKARTAVKTLQKEEAARSKEHKEALRAWRGEYDEAKKAATEAIKAEGVYTNQAERKLETNRRMLQWEAEHPVPMPEVDAGQLDVVAELLGYSSGDEMMRAIRTAPPLEELVEGVTDRRLLENFGDLTTVEGMNRAADEAVHNDARARFIASGLKALQEGRKADGPKGPSVAVMTKAAKQFAEQLVARKKIRELRPGQHLGAETRAGKAALEAAAKGDTKRAIAAQRDQLLNHYAARETQDALAEIEKRVKYLRGFEKNTTLPVEYREQIESLLDRFSLRDISLRQIDKNRSLAEWVESQRAIGIDPELSPALLDEARRQNYRDMTVEEFRGLVDAVKQIEHLGRLKDKLLTAKDQRDFETTRDAIAQSVIDNRGKHQGADTRSPTTATARWWKAIKDFGAAHIKAATLARVLDGGKDGGQMWENFIRVANERGDYETTERAKATKALTDILAPVFGSGKLGGKGKYFPSVQRSFNRESLIAIALNTGNEGNLQRLLGGEGWTVEQLQPLLSALSAKDWQAVQAIWDHFDSYRSEIAAKQRRVYGTEPDWIEAKPREVQTADGKTLQVRGGYYPIKYDPAASVRAEEHADAEGAKRALQGAYGAATTRRSFIKTRSEEVVGRPLLYTLAGVYSGVNDVIHDLAWHEWLIDTNRLLKSKAIDGAIRENYGPEVVRQFKTWRDAIAEGDSGAQEALDTALGKLRQGVSVAGLGFNVMSALMQPLGMTQSIVRVGAKHIARGITQYIAHPVKAAREVQEQSEFMANRARTRFRELRELTDRIQGQTSVKQKIAENAYFLMMKCQQMVDVPTWLGAYDKAISEGNAEDRAVALADQAVIDAQGGGQTKDLSAIERGGPAQKLFTVFYSFMNTAHNLSYASRHTGQSAAKAAADMLLIYCVPAVLGSLLKSALTPGDSGDDESWKKLSRKLIGEQLSFVMGTMVVGREFAEAGKAAFGLTDHARDYSGPAGLRVIADVSSLAKQVQQGELDDQFRKALVNVLGATLGLPAAQANRTITGAKALSEGKTKNPAALLLGYQEPSP